MKKETYAVIYCRYSSHHQGEQSIEGQLSAAKRYAEAKGYTVVHEYIDRAVSGRTDDRAEFQKMLSDCAKKQFEVIIVWKVDRFGRNREEITFNKYRAKKHGVRVEYVAENLPDSPESVILESVLEGMAEYYSLQLAQNVSRGMLESAKKHKMIGGKGLLGYRPGPDLSFEIDPETAPVVKMIFEKYVSGHSISQIIKYLNENGYRTKRGKLFTKNSIPSMLKNEKYMGVYTYKDIIRDENAIPAIIDADTFYKAQKRLKINRRKPSRVWGYSDYALTDKLFCGYCGKGMIGKSGYGKLGKKYNYYVCFAHSKNVSACNKKAIRQDVLEPIVLGDIQKILLDDSLLNFIADTTWQYYQKDDSENQQIVSLTNQIKEIDKSITNLVKSIEAGLFNDTIKSRMEDLENQKTAIKKALADKELERGFRLQKEHITFFLYKLRNLDIHERDSQRRLIDTFVNAIYVYDDHINITFNYGGDDSSISLEEIEKATTGFDCDCLSSPLPSGCERITWYQHVFIITISLEK